MMCPDREGFAAGKLWSLWKMLKVKVGRLLQLHERLNIDKGLFERAHHELTAVGIGDFRFEHDEFLRLRDAVAELEEIADSMNLTTTQVAANRTRQAMDAIGHGSGLALVMRQDNCGTLFRHLLEIVSRLRDDCSDRIYFQIAPEDARLLEMDADHFGPEVRNAFGDAVEDIAEAANCLALERPTACVFHLMRALEAAATVVADKIGAAVIDEHGRGLAWGVIAANMKAKNRQNAEGQRRANKMVQGPIVAGNGEPGLAHSHRASEENLHPRGSQTSV
jgi:hypothetical protein